MGMSKQRQALQTTLDALTHARNASLDGSHFACRQILLVQINEIREALVEPEQEPVAWRITDGEGDWEYRTKPPLETDIQWSARYGRKYEPLYPSPPTRKPLTEPELHAIEPTWPHDWGYDQMLAFVRAIERAHGIGEA